MNIPPREAEKAVSLILIRVRAALKTEGEARVEGLGTFRSDEDGVIFEPSSEFANEINRDFSGMKPVALTATGESVELDDTRALPGKTFVTGSETTGESEEDSATPGLGEQVLQGIGEEPDKTGSVGEEPPRESTAPVTAESPVAEETTGYDEPPVEEQIISDDELLIDEGVTAEEELTAEETATSEPEHQDEPERAPTFKSPPPPIPSKVRVPPRERHSSHRRRARETEGREDFPDMESVVSTRPVQPIHGPARKKERSRMPVFVVVAVVVLAAASWVFFGSRGSEKSAAMPPADKVATSQPVQNAPTEAAADNTPVQETAGEAASPSDESTEPENAPAEVAAVATSPAASEPQAQPEPAASAEPEATLDSQGPSQPEREPAQNPVKSEPEPSTPAPAHTYSWIVASYPTRTEAETRVDKLRNAGLEANVYEATVRGQQAYRVGVGTFPSEAEAWRSHADIPPEAVDAWILKVR